MLNTQLEGIFLIAVGGLLGIVSLFIFIPNLIGFVVVNT